MARCPSEDWDDHVAEQERAAAAETAWWSRHGDRVLAVAGAVLTGHYGPRTPADQSDVAKRVVELAACVVREVVARAEPCE